MGIKKKLKILLADDDSDDTFFFARALKSVSTPSEISSVADGEMLMDYLDKGKGNLPDILFLDINMPRKNGMECLIEIKANEETKDLPIIIYSTSVDESVADIFYDKGAFYCLKKGDFNTLIQNLEYILSNFQNKSLKKPARGKFIFDFHSVTTPIMSEKRSD